MYIYIENTYIRTYIHVHREHVHTYVHTFIPNSAPFITSIAFSTISLDFNSKYAKPLCVNVIYIHVRNVYINIHRYSYIYINMYAYIYIYIYLGRLFSSKEILKSVTISFPCIYKYIHIYIHIYISVCINIYIYIYIYILMYTSIYIYILGYLGRLFSSKEILKFVTTLFPYTYKYIYIHICV
jgi:hypothetical protein